MTNTVIPLSERAIVALDVPDANAAQALVETLSPTCGFFKIGLELFVAEHFRVVDAVRDFGAKVMLDLKFFDVPETVRRAVARLEGRGADLITVHGNDAIVRAAAQAKGSTRVLAVTVLTSFDEADMRAMGMTGPVEELVLLRARRAVELGLDGVVASGREAAVLRSELGEDFLIVTPGVRRAGDAKGDQSRVVTPGAAIRAGADHIVIGRPVRDAADPRATLVEIQAEIGRALDERG